MAYRQWSKTVRPAAPITKYKDPTSVGLPMQLKTDLINYSGSNSFLITLREQVSRWGHLSEKQWRIAFKHLNVPTAPSVVQYPELLLNAPLPIFVNRTAAFREIRDKYKLSYGIFALKITKVFAAGKARNGNHWAELEVVADTDSAVSCCRICGKTLTDQRSIVSGIGPECAKRLGAIYHTYKADIQKFMADFKTHAAAIGPMRVKIWENQIKENHPNFMLAHRQFTSQTPLTPIMPALPLNAPQKPTPPPFVPNASELDPLPFILSIRPTDLRPGPVTSNFSTSVCIDGSFVSSKYVYLTGDSSPLRIDVRNIQTGNLVRMIEYERTADKIVLAGYTADGKHGIRLQIDLNR